MWKPNNSTTDCLTVGQNAAKRNISLLFSNEMDSDHYNDLISVEQKKRPCSFDEVYVFRDNVCRKHFLQIAVPFSIYYYYYYYYYYRRYGETYDFHPQGWKVSQARNQHEAGSKQFRMTFNGLHGVIPHKREFFIIFIRCEFGII
jgi:hypothetical protein